MKINCPGCNKAYNIPDDKIPAGKKFELPCPACKTKIPVESGTPASAKGASAENRLKNGEALMKKIVRESKALPPMPEIMSKLTDMISRDDTGFREIGEVIKTDQAMATRVLKLANSAYYGLSVPVSTVEQASALLGFQALLELVTVVSTSKMMGKSLTGYGIDSKDMWRHSISVATGSKIIATRKYPALVNDSFNAGLIHDSGMIIMDPFISKLSKEFHALLSREELPYYQIEQQIFGFDHAIIASEFFKTWKLPQAQTTAIRYHHNPSASNGDPLSYIIHAADSIVMHLEAANFEAKRFYKTDEGVWDFLGLNEQEIEEITEETTEAVKGLMESI